MVVHVLAVAAQPRHDDGDMAMANSEKDAPHAGVGDHGICGVEMREHLVEAHELLGYRRMLRRASVTVLDYQVASRQCRNRVHESWKSVVVGSDCHEDHSTEPA